MNTKAEANRKGHHFIKCVRPESIILSGNYIAKVRKPFTIGEEFILPAAKDMCHEMLQEASVQKVAWIHLANLMTNSRGCCVIIIRKYYESLWNRIQVHKPVNVDNKAAMFVFV